MKTARLLIIFIFPLAALCACRSEDPFKKVVFADSPEMFNLITPVGRSSSSYIVNNVSYNIAFDDDKKKATVTINDLKMSANAPGEIVTFSNVDWNYVPGSHETQRAIRVPIMSPDSPGNGSTLTDVEIIYSESNKLSNVPTAGFYASYVVNGAYSVVSYPYIIYADGTTTVRTDNDIMPQTVDYEPVYVLSLHPESMSLDMNVRNIDIDGERLDFSISGITMILTDEGYNLDETEWTAITASNGTSINVSDIAGVAVLRDELNLTMIVEYMNTMYYIEAYLAPDYNSCKRSCH